MTGLVSFYLDDENYALSTGSDGQGNFPFEKIRQIGNAAAL